MIGCEHWERGLPPLEKVSVPRGTRAAPKAATGPSPRPACSHEGWLPERPGSGAPHPPPTGTAPLVAAGGGTPPRAPNKAKARHLAWGPEMQQIGEYLLPFLSLEAS